jgi:hypothetical protein
MIIQLYVYICILARLMVKPNRLVMPCMLDPCLFHLVVTIHQPALENGLIPWFLTPSNQNL